MRGCRTIHSGLFACTVYFQFIAVFPGQIVMFAVYRVGTLYRILVGPLWNCGFWGIEISFVLLTRVFHVDISQLGGFGREGMSAMRTFNCLMCGALMILIIFLCASDGDNG